jgi:hypothetical protein
MSTFRITDYIIHPVTLIGGIALVIAIAIYAEIQDNREWEAFRTAHKCKVVAHVSSSSTTAVGFSSSGNMTVTPIHIPSKTGWLCDDGVTYYR